MLEQGFGCIPKSGSSRHSSAAQPTLHTQQGLFPGIQAAAAPKNYLGEGSQPSRKEAGTRISLLLFLIILRVTTMERIFKCGHFLVPIYNACLLLAHYLVWTQQTKHSAAVSRSPLLAQGCCTWLAKALWKCLNLNKKTVFISN